MGSGSSPDLGIRSAPMRTTAPASVAPTEPKALAVGVGGWTAEALADSVCSGAAVVLTITSPHHMVETPEDAATHAHPTTAPDLRGLPPLPPMPLPRDRGALKTCVTFTMAMVLYFLFSSLPPENLCHKRNGLSRLIMVE